jgi:hypothetical protein
MGRLISDLVLAHAGRPAVVMGGATSLPGQVAQLEGLDPIWLSANEHGALLRRVDYLVHCDLVHQRAQRPMVDVLRAYAQPMGAPILSPLLSADYRLPGWDVRRQRGNSGMWAIEAAWLVGCHPIIATGMDCYTGPGTYYHELDAPSSSLTKAAAEFDDLLDALKARIPGAVVRVMDQRMARHWPLYDPAEQLPPFAATPQLLAAGQATGIPVRFLRTGKFCKQRFAAGDQVEMTRAEAAHLSHIHLVEPLP